MPNSTKAAWPFSATTRYLRGPSRLDSIEDLSSPVSSGTTATAAATPSSDSLASILSSFVGQGTYPGELPKGWGYDTRRTPEAHDPADPTLWYYYDRDGDLRCTRGRVASGYMLAASGEMRRKVLEIAREVFA